MSDIYNIPLESQHTTVDDTHIHAEGFAREVRNVGHIIAKVPDTYDHVEDCGPNTDPCCESWVDGRVIPLDNVINRVVEQGDETRNPDNGKWLAREKTEYHSS